MAKEDSKREVPDLSYLRREIEKTDSEIIRLFHQRMGLAGKVAAFKIATGQPVYDPGREEILVKCIVDMSPENEKTRCETLLRSLMRLSRGVQYEMILKSGSLSPLGLEEREDIDLNSQSLQIVCQGMEGSYSMQASRVLFPGRDCVLARTFAGACEMVSSDQADVAVLPLENSTAGTVNEVYDLLLKHGLYVWRSVSLPIRHHLLTVPGARLGDIRTVISHPQALAQCAELIRRYGWQTKESLNTAFAAKRVSEAADPGLAAIASDAAASEFSLEMLLSDISDASSNQTRFIAAGKKLHVTPDANRVSLILRLPHQSGALAATLAIFSDRRLNLSKIQSRPDPAQPWNYLFYLDFEGGFADLPAIKATLYHLEQEMPFCRLLGWYCEQNEEEDK